MNQELITAYSCSNPFMMDYLIRVFLVRNHGFTFPYVNSQYNHYRSSENPNTSLERPLHDTKVGVWCAVSEKIIIGPGIPWKHKFWALQGHRVDAHVSHWTFWFVKYPVCSVVYYTELLKDKSKTKEKGICGNLSERK